MNFRQVLPASLLALVGLLATSQPMLAAASKADQRTAALVAALQAVSPDPLGGRLGLAVADSGTTTTPAATKAQSSQMTGDQRAYARWKTVTKS